MTIEATEREGYAQDRSKNDLRAHEDDDVDSQASTEM